MVGRERERTEDLHFLPYFGAQHERVVLALARVIPRSERLAGLSGAHFVNLTEKHLFFSEIPIDAESVVDVFADGPANCLVGDRVRPEHGLYGSDRLAFVINLDDVRWRSWPQNEYRDDDECRGEQSCAGEQQPPEPLVVPGDELIFVHRGVF